MLKRAKPDLTIPLHPEPEYLVEGEKKALYEDTKKVLQVPWVGVVTMALAHYQDFYKTLWHGLRPIMDSAELVELERNIRLWIEREITQLAPPPCQQKLVEMGYAPREIDQIRQAVEIFSHGNMPYVIIISLARMALENKHFPAQRAAKSAAPPHAPKVDIPLILMEQHHSDTQMQAVYSDVKKTLGLPFVNTDYRALARWPSYFSHVWHDLRPHIHSAQYEKLVADYHDLILEGAAQLPNPSGITAEEICAAAGQAGAPGEILSVVQLFQWLLPGLITNVAFFRAQLL